MGARVDFPVFDADNHYYEAIDAFTRHCLVDAQALRCSGPRSTGRSGCSSAAVNRFIPNPTFDPVAKPGA